MHHHRHCHGHEHHAAGRRGFRGPPFAGGPFRAMDTWGMKHIVNTMRELQGKYGPRFAPAAMLERMAEKGEGFYS